MTDQSAPNPVRRAAEAVTTTAANGWNALVALAPSINNVISAIAVPVASAIVAAMLTWGGMTYSSAAKSTLPVIADQPQSLPTPAVSMENLDHALALHCGAAQSKLDILLERTAPKGTMKKTSGKK